MGRGKEWDAKGLIDIYDIKTEAAHSPQTNRLMCFIDPVCQIWR